MSKIGISQNLVSELLQFKASERKDDPGRRLGIHGPYEELVLRRTGRLPNDYFDGVSAEPWGLRNLESRSNIIWQVLSGAMDTESDFASSYLSLALDKSLSEDDYAKELFKLNRDWGDFIHHSSLNTGHRHGKIAGHAGSMSETYARVSCPACSVLTAVALRDAGMHEIFTQMRDMKPRDRKAFLEKQGFAPLLDTMIGDLKDAVSAQPKVIGFDI